MIPSCALIATGGNQVVITLSDENASGVNLGGGLATASWGIYADGSIVSNNGSYNWRIGGDSADFQVKATLNSGSVASGSSPTNTWLSCSGTQSWSVTSNFAGGVVSAQLGVSIRDAASPNAVRATATIDLTADSENGA